VAKHRYLLITIAFFLAIISINIKAKSNHNSKTKHLILGSSMPLRGGLEKLARDISNGISIVFNNANKTNILNSYVLDFAVLDDRYKENLAKINFNNLSKKTSLFFSPFGENYLSIIPKKRFNEFSIIFPYTGMPEFRSRDYNSIVFFRPPLKKEIRLLVNYAINNLESKRIGVFYEESPWGNEGLKLVKEEIKDINNPYASLVISAAYSKNTVNIKNALKKIGNQKPEKTPDTIICISHYRATHSFIREASAKGLHGCNFLSTGESSLIQKDLYESRGIKLVTTSVTPNPWNSNLEIAKEYRKEIKEHFSNYDISIPSFEGYITASIFVEALKKIDTDLTNEKIIKEIKNMKNLRFRGLDLEWKNETNSLSSYVWLNKGQNFKWKKY